jgi:hypothetical protein
MKDQDKNIEQLFNRLADRTLCDFDWDRLRLSVAARLAGVPRRQRRIGRLSLVSAAAAAVLLLALTLRYRGSMPGWHSRVQPQQVVSGSATSEADPLLASTDPASILAHGALRVLVSNDPALAFPGR